MEEEEKAIMNKALPYLVAAVKVTPHFKATLLSSSGFDDRKIDTILESNDQEEVVFQLVQYLKRKNGDAFGDFIRILRSSKQHEVADKLEDARDKGRWDGGEKQSGKTAAAAQGYNYKGGPKTSDAGGGNGLKRAAGSGDRTPTEDPKGLEFTNLPYATASTDQGASSQPCRNTSRDDILIPENVLPENRREVLTRLLSQRDPSRAKRESGDICVKSDYLTTLRSFASGQSDQPPGSLKILSLEAAAHYSDNIKYLSPECCAKVAQFFGGIPNLRFGRYMGPKAFLTMESVPAFVSVILYVQPSEKMLAGHYLSLKHSMREAVAACIGTYPSRVMTKNSDVPLDLDMTVHEWYHNSKKASLLVWV